MVATGLVRTWRSLKQLQLADCSHGVWFFGVIWTGPVLLAYRTSFFLQTDPTKVKGSAQASQYNWKAPLLFLGAWARKASRLRTVRQVSKLVRYQLASCWIDRCCQPGSQENDACDVKGVLAAEGQLSGGQGLAILRRRPLAGS